jgi:hypothetical protein
MTKPAKISEIVDTIEFQFDNMHAYFDRETGQTVAFGEDEISQVEDMEDNGDEDADEYLVLIRDALNAEAGEGPGDRFLALPDRFEIDEWDMMRRFAEGLDDDRASDDLLRAIRGRGAFRYFKDRVHALGLAEKWYAFRDEQFRQVAIKWCKANNIEITPED